MYDSDDEGPDRQLKLVVLGDSGSGKTSLCMRYCQEQFRKEYSQTVGVDFFLKRIVLPGFTQVAMEIWDVGGQAIGSPMLSSYLSGAQGVLFVYDISRYSSFENLDQWNVLVKKAFTVGQFPRVVIMANKTDLEHARTVRLDRHHKFSQQYGMASYFVSAKTGDAVSQCFQQVAADILNVRLTKPDVEQQQRVVKAEVIHSQDDMVVARACPTSAKSSFCAVQ